MSDWLVKSLEWLQFPYGEYFAYLLTTPNVEREQKLKLQALRINKKHLKSQNASILAVGFEKLLFID